MSIFASILSKLGFHPSQVQASSAAPAAAPPPAPTVPAATAADAPSAPVDVVGQLEALAAKNPEKLNWRVSIVDLMKLLGLDSSFAARKQLATELNCPADKMADSAQMNMWLHQQVLQKLAANGGNVPPDLLR
jgi:3-oxoacyl-ACP reductase-like protein